MFAETAGAWVGRDCGAPVPMAAGGADGSAACACTVQRLKAAQKEKQRKPFKKTLILAPQQEEKEQLPKPHPSLRLLLKRHSGKWKA